jgi:hypothetical protein
MIRIEVTSAEDVHLMTGVFQDHAVLRGRDYEIWQVTESDGAGAIRRAWRKDGRRLRADVQAGESAHMAVRGCGERHLGVCWTERFNRWWPDQAPADEYPLVSDWARLGPEGWQPKPCRPFIEPPGLLATESRDDRGHPQD